MTDTTTPCHCGSESDGNEEVLHIPQISRTGASLMQFVSNLRQSAYSIATADGAGQELVSVWDQRNGTKLALDGAARWSPF